MFYRLNVIQQHTSTTEDEISNRLAVLQVCFDVLDQIGILFNANCGETGSIFTVYFI